MKDVLSVYNDLVLCYWGYSSNDSSIYYIICNPYTSHRVALPPAPACHDILPAELICDPYYKFPEDDNKSCEQNIIVNAEYRCKVVRFHLYMPDPFRCKMDMFSSETGVWKELVVVSPREFGVYCNDSFPRAGFPCKGKLYGAGTGGVMALDLLAYNGNNSSSACDGREVFDKCYFVELDEVKLPVHLDKFLCESRGMLCLVVFQRIYEDVHIWEMKGDVEDGCCFTIRQRVCLLPRMERSGLWLQLYDEREATRLFPLDSFDEDIMYLQSSRSIFMTFVQGRY